jgi:hypothetical protein
MTSAAAKQLDRHGFVGELGAGGTGVQRNPAFASGHRAWRQRTDYCLCYAPAANDFGFSGGSGKGMILA